MILIGAFLEFSLSIASKYIGLEGNAEKTRYMITSRLQNEVLNQNIIIGNVGGSPGDVSEELVT